jgi:hypothetical protein
MRLYGVTCNDSNSDGYMSLHAPGQTHSIHFIDTTYGQNWHWNFNIQ